MDERETPNGRKTLGAASNLQRRNPVDYHTLRAELFSVFIDNIPMGKEVDWLRALFSMDGKALEVFIPARGRRATNTRFGFVRYRTLVEAKAAIRRWNGANVGKAKLMVLLADNGGKPKVGSRFIRRRQQGGRSGPVEEGLGSVWRPKLVQGDQVNMGGGRPKAQATV
ncbi:hypothetical protein QQ045_008802 [Rhodiola kirilowii]